MARDSRRLAWVIRCALIGLSWLALHCSSSSQNTGGGAAAFAGSTASPAGGSTSASGASGAPGGGASAAVDGGMAGSAAGAAVSSTGGAGAGPDLPSAGSGGLDNSSAGMPSVQGAVTIYRDASAGPVLFAATEANRALQKRGYTVSEKGLDQLSGTGDAIRIVIGVATPALVQQLQMQGGASIGTLKSQAFALRTTTVAGTAWYWALGGDLAGAMYGGLELSDTIRLDTIGAVASGDHAAFVERRGIKFNIPLDVRTPSYSDAGEAAWNNVEVMWDIEFWKGFLDDLARYRYNTVSLWNLNPFPSMLKVPGFLDVSLKDVKKNTVVFSSNLVGEGMVPQNVLDAAVVVKTLTIEEKIAFWQEVMQYAKDRSIDFYVFTWNLFTFTADGHDGITKSQSNPATLAYFRAAAAQMFETYPLLAGMGVTAGESMPDPGKEKWLYDSYGLGMADARKTQPNREMRLITRLNGTSVSQVSAAFGSYSGVQDFSFKYSQAHMLSSTTPHFVDPTLSAMATGKRTWLEVRNDDMYLMRWGDPEYARAYLRNMPPSSKSVGFLMGPDGYIWGREFVSTEPDSPRQMVVQKWWYSFYLWGRLAYDPTLPADQFSKALADRFPGVDGAALLAAWSSVSKILPLVTQFHWSKDQLDYQWYPEACIGPTFHDVTRFMTDGTFPGSNLVDIPTYTAAIAGGTKVTGTSPLDVAAQLQSFAATGVQKIAGISAGTNKELRLTLGDISAMAYLGQYYAEKILGATSLSLYQKTSDASKKAAAVQHLTAAATAWRSYAKQMSLQYKPQVLTRMGTTPVDLSALSAEVDKDVTIASK